MKSWDGWKGKWTLQLAVFVAAMSTAWAAPLMLDAYKDRLFAYPPILQSAMGGAYRVVDYREERDINGRDAIPERRVRGPFVSTSVLRSQHDLVVATPAGRLRHFAVGKLTGARLITIYLHGQGGNRRQGVNDFTFGGNFNRIKNLMVRNDGLYLSPDFSDFGVGGAEQIAALIAHYANGSPAAPVFIACGSMGGALCWRMAAREGSVGTVSGLLLLGTSGSETFLQSAGFKHRVPLLFAHGSNDKVYPVERQEAFFRSILQKAPDYPAQFVRFETGSHGTPIRMVDWRETLNWMLAMRP